MSKELSLITSGGEEKNITERLFIGKMLSLFKVPERLSTQEYAETYRWLTSEVSAKPGKMDCMETPFMLFPMECMDNVDIKVIVGQKSAQIAWSETTNSYMSKRMDIDPQNIIVAFPRMESAKKYSREKIKPMIKSIPRLLENIGNPDRCSYKFFKFHGGWLSLVTARSTEDLKSSSAPIIIVEEPDGLQEDVGDQGDALDLLMQRQKTYIERKLIYAGTPTDEDFSRVAKAYQQSNQMVFMVPCKDCGELQEFDFQYLKCEEYSNRFIDPVYGKWNPKTAYYCCKYCSSTWSDEDRKIAVRKALEFNNKGWIALRPEETDIYGFAFNELMSSFAASTHYELMKKKIKAEIALTKGNEGLMKSFVNNSEGKAYATRSIGLDVQQMQKRRQNYQEGFVPFGGIALTAGIDVQHNRFAIIVRAWGQGGNSWLVLWTEIFGNVLDPSDSVWEELTEMMVKGFPHVAKTISGNPVQILIEAISIDASDGRVTELVYRWADAMNTAGIPTFAAKGSTDTNFNADIYCEPAAADQSTQQQERKSLAERMGVNVFVYGAHKAHEEIIRRLSLTGTRDRYYHNETSYGQYEEQMLSCTKEISVDGKITRFKLKPGKRKEAMDSEKLALHAYYAIQLRNWTDEHWFKAEKQILKNMLIENASNVA